MIPFQGFNQVAALAVLNRIILIVLYCNIAAIPEKIILLVGYETWHHDHSINLFLGKLKER